MPPSAYHWNAPHRCRTATAWTPHAAPRPQSGARHASPRSPAERLTCLLQHARRPQPSSALRPRAPTCHSPRRSRRPRSSERLRRLPLAARRRGRPPRGRSRRTRRVEASRRLRERARCLRCTARAQQPRRARHQRASLTALRRQRAGCGPGCCHCRSRRRNPQRQRRSRRGEGRHRPSCTPTPAGRAPLRGRPRLAGSRRAAVGQPAGTPSVAATEVADADAEVAAAAAERPAKGALVPVTC